MPSLIRSTVPVLATLDLTASQRFYIDKLGFVQRLLADDYLIVEREGAELHFWLCDDPYIARNTSCYVRVTDTDTLHAEFMQRGLPLEPPQVREWGMKELYVIDPHGNLLKFGEEV
jgi:catechol 2,3-dioxygenase-like lactoylglutathione lyase family enzyme